MKSDHELAKEAGWEVKTESFFDEEGVEGWSWTEPNGTEHNEIGAWNESPMVPESAKVAIEALRAGMTETAKHTPGPWAVEDIDSEDGPEIYSKGKARIAYTSLCCDPREVKANARLIAAAPELLEVCRLIADHQYDQGTGYIAVQAARATIERATQP